METQPTQTAAPGVVRLEVCLEGGEVGGGSIMEHAECHAKAFKLDLGAMMGPETGE